MNLKHLKYVFVTLCFVILCLYLVRSPISMRVANHFLVPLNAQVTCLSWSLHSWRTIQIEQLCIKAEQGDVRATNALLSYDNLSIAQLDVQPKVAQQQPQSKQAFKPLELALPQRPMLNITRLNIAKTPYTPPLTLSVAENELNHLLVTGDIKAAVVLANNEINARLDASSPLVQSQLPKLISSLRGYAEIQFYGDKLQANIAHSLQAQVQYQACEVNLDSVGAGTLFFDLNTQVAQVDMAKPTNTLSPSGCDSLLPEAHRAAFETMLTQPVNIQFAQPIQFDNGQLKTTNVNITSVDDLTQLQISNIRFEPAILSLSSDVTVKHRGAYLGSLLWQGSVNYQNNQLFSEGTFEHSAQHLALLPFNHQGVLLSGKTVLSQFEDDLKFNYQGRGRVDSLSHAAFLGEQLQFDIAANMTLSSTLQGDVNLDVLLERAQFQDIALKQAHANIVAVLDTEQQLTAKTKLKVSEVVHPQVSVSGVSADYQFNADVGAGEFFLDIVGQTTLAKLKTSQLTLSNLLIESKGQQNRGGRFEHALQGAGLTGLFSHQYSTLHHAYEFNLTSDNVTELQPLMSQLSPKLKLVQGNLSLHSRGDLNLQTANFEAQVADFSLLYDTHYIDDMNTEIVGVFNSGNVNIPETTVTVGQIRSGVVLSELKTHLHVEDNQAYLSQSHAKVFDGSIDVPMIKLSTEPQVIDVQAQALDLAQIAQAGRDAGIELAGRVSGKFPIKLEDMQMSIEQGQLINSGIGQLKVAQNASIEALKAQQPSLKSVIGVLDDLTIDKLTSDVALSPDGWLTLGVKIVGENKAQAQPVNFNYTHQENIFTLFRALRLSDELTQKVEDALTK